MIKLLADHFSEEVRQLFLVVRSSQLGQYSFDNLIGEILVMAVLHLLEFDWYLLLFGCVGRVVHCENLIQLVLGFGLRRLRWYWWFELQFSFWFNMIISRVMVGRWCMIWRQSRLSIWLVLVPGIGQSYSYASIRCSLNHLLSVP